MQKIIAAGQFKTHCLKLMDEVQSKHLTLLITKHGVPVAKLAPIEDEPLNLYGALKGTIKSTGNLITPIDNDWDAES